MNNREVNAVIHNSQFTIHNYDYRNSWQYAIRISEFKMNNNDDYNSSTLFE